MPREIQSQEEQFPDRVAEERQGDDRMRMQDISPKIHFDMGGDPERAKTFEDAFARRLLQETSPEAQEARDMKELQRRVRQRDRRSPSQDPAGTSSRETPTSAPIPTPRTPRPRDPSRGSWTPPPDPEGYEGLVPQNDEDWGQFARLMFPNVKDPVKSNVGAWKKRIHENPEGWLNHWPNSRKFSPMWEQWKQMRQGAG